MAFTIHDVLLDLKGKNIRRMSPADYASFREAATAAFRRATGDVAMQVLGGAPDQAENYIWDVRPSEYDQNDLLATYSLRPGRAIEDCIGQPALLQLAAAIFTYCELKIQLLAEADFGPAEARWTRESSLEISVSVAGDPWLLLLEDLDESLCSELSSLCREHGLRLQVGALEGGTDWITNPTDIGEAIRGIGQAARVDAAESGSPADVSAIELTITLPVTAIDDPALVDDAIAVVGAIFAWCDFERHGDT